MKNVLKNLFILSALLILSTNAWGAVTEQGSSLKQVTINGNSYHVVMESTTPKEHQYGDNESVSRNNTAPAGALFIQMRRSSGTAAIDQKEKVQCSVDGKTYKDVATENLKDVTSYTYFGPYTTNVTRDTKYIRTSWSYGTKYRSYQNVYLTMASYCETTTTEINFGSDTYGNAEDETFTINWSNIADAEISISGTDASHYEILESKAYGNKYLGSATGKYGYTTVTVRYKRDVVDTHNSATLSVNGVSVALKGSTTKLPNAITWTPDVASKKNWEQEVTMSATATNTDYVNYPITFSSSNNTYASVEGNVVTFHEAGAGQTVTIYANQATSSIYFAPEQASKTFTIKSSQSIVWDLEKLNTNIRLGETRDIASYASASPSGSRQITFTSEDPSIISVDGTEITAEDEGKVNILATLEGDDDYQEVTSSKEFEVKNLATPVFIPSGFNEESTKELYVGQSVTMTVSGVSDGLNGDFTASATQDDSKDILAITREGNTITIEALNEGESTTTFTQTENDDIFGATVSYAFSVTKVENTFTVTADEEYFVDDFEENVVSTNSDGEITTSSTDETVAYYDKDLNKLCFPNSEAKSFEEKDVTIIISQAATYKYTAAAETINVIVKKYENKLYINGTPNTKAFTLNLNDSVAVSFSADNDEEGCPDIDWEQSAIGAGYARYDEENGKVYSNYTLGMATWTISQEEDYKYLGGEAVFTVTVALDVPSCTSLYLWGDENAVSASSGWGSGAQYCDPIPVSGIGDQLTFYAKRGGTGDVSIVEYSTDNGSNWTVLTSKVGVDENDYKNTPFGPYSFPDLEPGKRVTHIRFGVSGSTSWLSYYYKDIVVTRKQSIGLKDADGKEIFELAFDNINKGGSTTKTFYLDYSTCGDKISLVSNQPHITFGNTGKTKYEIEGDHGYQAITLTYSSAELEEIEGTITIYTQYERKTITISAATVKRQQTITWNPESLTANTLDAVKLSASAVEKVIFSESSDIATISIVDGDTLLTFTGSGDVTVYADAAENDDYYAATQASKTWTVSKTPTEVVTPPAIEAFTSGTYDDSMIDDSGAYAQDTEESEVTGSYALKTGEDVTTVGTREITLVFTPDNEAMYASSECTVSITVNAKEEEYDPEAADPWSGVDENTAIIVPSAANNVTITGTVYAYSVTIEDGASLTLAPGSALILTENIHKEEGSTFAEEDLVLNSSASDGLGVLVIGETATNIPASINFYSKATLENRSGGWVNQHIGAAYTTASNNLYANYYGCQIYPYNEATENWGAQLGKDDTMTPFKGYNLLRDTEKFPWPVEGMINMEGTLVSNGNQSLNLYYKDGAVRTENFLANSWPAPIDITAFDLTENVDFVNAEQAIYIFNSGTKAQAEAAGAASATATSPGQYIALPLGSVSWTKVATKVIPPLQGFSVYATGADAKLNLNYKRLVYAPAAEGNTGSTPNRVRRRAQEEMPTRLLIQVEGESGYSDEVYVFERGDFSTGFDNGYDGRKMDGTSATPQLSAVTEDGKMAINCVPEMNGTDLSFKAGKEDTSYTLTFDYNGDETLYLVDNDEVNRTGNGVTEISNDNTYTFKTSNRKATARFTVTSNPSRIATGVENVQDDDVQGTKVRKIMRDGDVYLMYNGTMYDAQGKRVK